MILDLQQGLADHGIKIPLATLCRWFGVARRTLYYKTARSAPRINPALAEPTKVLIEKNPSFGYRTIIWLLGFNKKLFAADVSVQSLARQKGPCGCTPQDQGIAIGGRPSEPAKGDGSRTFLGGTRWLDEAGARHELPYTRAA